MATQADVVRRIKSIHVFNAGLDARWWALMVVVLMLAVGAGLVLRSSSQPAEASDNALNVISARYQGMADVHAAGVKAEAQRGLEILSARYQGMADLYLTR